MQESLWIQRHIAPLVTSSNADGLRDDVAILTATGTMIATMDTLVQGVHFLPEDPLTTVGQKLVRVNVSDIFAKGALPCEALLSIAWPAARPESEFRDLMAGIGADLKTYQIDLIGGDLVRTGGPLALTLTLTGHCLKSHPVRRSGGAPGQSLYIDGAVGWGGLGLAAARNAGDPNIIARYRVPQISSREIAQTVSAVAEASLDISDGLLIDAQRLATASACGAEIALERVPLAAPTDQIDDILAQCTAGDDYRILISAPEGLSIAGFVEIGRLSAQSGLRLMYRGQFVNPPSTLGFEH